MRGDPADVMASVGRSWGWVLAFGILTLAIGIAALVWPGRTLVVVAVLFGIQLILMGIFRFVAAFASDDLTGGTRAGHARVPDPLTRPPCLRAGPASG